MTTRRDHLELDIRPAEAQDYDAILQLWSEAGLSVRCDGRESRQAFVRQLDQLRPFYLVATEAGRIIGVVLGSHDHRKGWINRLAVRPSYRRRGVAAALVGACEAALRAEGIEILAALIEEDNEASAALFESLGYRSDVPVLYYRKVDHPGA